MECGAGMFDGKGSSSYRILLNVAQYIIIMASASIGLQIVP